MKNTHLIPTYKPSRLFEILQFNFIFDNQNKYSEEYKKLHKYKNQHIYITNDEEIKEGDWFYDLGTHLGTKYIKIKQSWENSHLDFNGKKIILTTDQDLIKDGVQAIDDEFLEWFVKNPSCEEVEVFYQLHKDEPLYKLIIPKEEPKQETLEEAAKSEAFEFKVDYKPFETDLNYGEYAEFGFEKGFIAGAKWQAERMYSEEEVDKLISDFKHDLRESTSNYVKQNCEGAIFGLKRLKQFKKK